jgi:hypothetical protein
MPRTAMLNSGLVRYAQNISVGPHLLEADETMQFRRQRCWSQSV